MATLHSICGRWGKFSQNYSYLIVSLSLNVGLRPRGNHMEQHLPVAGDGGARVFRVGWLPLRREGEENGAPPFPRGRFSRIKKTN